MHSSTLYENIVTDDGKEDILFSEKEEKKPWKNILSKKVPFWSKWCSSIF